MPPSISSKQKSENAQATIEWEGSGVSPDDEDGDVIEGSGDQNGLLFSETFFLIVSIESINYHFFILKLGDHFSYRQI